MGGGAAMRAAVRFAGIGLQNSGVRGLPENIAVRRAVRPSAASLISATDVDSSSKIEMSASSQTAPAIAWELDDWDLAGYDVEEKARVVFGPAPSLEETKEATSEIRDALDLMYFSPSKSAAAIDARSVVSESETCDLDQISVKSAPNHAFQAFDLLRENAPAQTVVASIAADPNVWNAVLQNDALKEFLQSQKKFMEAEDREEPLDGSADDSNDPGNFFTDLALSLKLAVIRWMNNMSALFDELLFPDTDFKTSFGSTNRSPSATSVCGTLFALASMVIMVVVLKRG